MLLVSFALKMALSHLKQKGFSMKNSTVLAVMATILAATSFAGAFLDTKELWVIGSAIVSSIYMSASLICCTIETSKSK